MAENENPPAGDPPAPPAADAPSADDIKAMKAALHKANKEAETNRLRVKELEDKDKDTTTRATEAATAAESRAAAAEARAMRLEVAINKGLNLTQAKRLVGDTVEELEADAAELLAAFQPPPATGDGDEAPATGIPARTPAPATTPAGSESPDPEPSTEKILEGIPRL